MPLIRDDKNLIEVKSSDGQNTYSLRTMIAGWARDRIEASRMKLQMSQDRMLGKNGGGDMIDLVLDAPTYHMVLKMSYIAKWDYREKGEMLPLTTENLRLMCAEDDDLVLAKIKELHKAQFGVDKTSPLEVPSEV